MDRNKRIEHYSKHFSPIEVWEEPPYHQYFEFWQNLIDTGMASQLEGSYGRNAYALILEGFCVAPEEPLTDEIKAFRLEQVSQWEFDEEMQKAKDEEDRIASQSFKTVLIDPPWNEQGGGKIKRGADRHYPLMKTPDIIRTILQVPQWNQIEENAHMYLWVTNNFLPDGLIVMGALGFKYKTNFVWVKNTIGLGQYFRGQHEICLFGTRGKKPTAPRTDNKSIPSVLKAPKSRHSAKPQSAYDLIEQRSKGAYMEIFARAGRPEWFSWGNEV